MGGYLSPPSTRKADAVKRFAVSMLLVAVLAAAVIASGCSNTAEPPSESLAPETAAPEQTAPSSEGTSAGPQAQTADVTELKIEDKTVGTGAEAKVGDLVAVHYTGWLTDGTEFDSSKGGEPFQFRIGEGRVIQGWEQGVPGMKVGGVRKLTIPPDLGYGPQGYPGAIPGNATLVFEVELVKVN